MRILQVVPYFHPAFGGPVSVVYNLSRELGKRKHEVSVCTTDAKNCRVSFKIGEDPCYVDGFYVRYFKNVAGLFSFFFSLGLVQFARKEIAKFDIIHLHGFRTFPNVVIVHYAKKHGVPYVLQAHGSLPRIEAKQRLKWIYDVFFGYKLLRDASKVIALSQTESEQYRCMGVPEEKIEIIPNGIDLSEYGDLPPKGSFKKKFGIGDDERIVLYLGRIHRIKGIDILVKAFVNIIEKLEGVRLVVVGPDDGYLSELEALIKTLNIEDSVLISCPLYGKDKIEAFVDADLYVLVSRYETFPMTALEAIACETPIILTENCGIAEYIKDKVGLIVKPDLNRVREALIEVLLNQDRQNTFRKNCRSVKEKFDISKTISKLEGVYEEAFSTKVDL